ncbi:MAG: hypothetical protein BGO21_19725 [Dyadobacter sp. 50-39]|uniref:hypothetical protein n=1 Tax=Dyadobacter sp. 50-39 TaxID=1895756 RepID=UPI0009650A05|nr:hypothetical protein [Dyadobacter sp. 50-39]OJV14906.1 MAG: hypothetical protein BGO21_19725 [Dyadobacter sp. 50-39]
MKQFFYSLDKTNQRILVVSFSICIVLLSASGLMLTVSKALASHGNGAAPDIIGVGCDNSFAYYYDAFGELRRQPLNEAKNR